MIVCSCGHEEWEVETNQVVQSYIDNFEECGTFDKWQEHTRTCSYCGANYTFGYYEDEGTDYACEECFAHVRKGIGLIDYWGIPEEQRPDNYNGGWCAFDEERGKYYETGWIYSEW